MQLDATTVIFALLAIFAIWKLRSVLGTRVTIERKRDPAPGFRPNGPETAARDAAQGPPPVSAAPPPAAVVPPAEIEAPTLAASRGLDDIRKADRTFDLQAFLGGAQNAYRMIIEAFSRGDRELLESLLGDEALHTFMSALDERGSTTPATLTQVADIAKVQVTNATQKDNVASITLRFRAHVVETPVASAEAPASQTIEANDVWTFARDVRSPDPNWKLVVTSTDDTH